MDKATLKQANQVLNLISQKDPPSDQLQALFASGLLSDLLDANVAEVDREKFRELLGLKLLLPLLTISVSDTSKLQPPFDGWEVKEDSISPIGTLELKLAEFLEKGETSVKGEEILKRAKKKGFTLGLRHAKAILAKKDRISKEWRKYCFVFPGTVCLGSDGHRYAPYLFWYGEWYLSWGGLVNVWIGNDRLVVCK